MIGRWEVTLLEQGGFSLDQNNNYTETANKWAVKNCHLSLNALCSFFPLSQSVFVLAHCRNTSFHAPQQQCYPLRCEKGETGKSKRDFPYRFLPGSACCKSCGKPKVCKSPCPEWPDGGGTATFRSSQGRCLLSSCPSCEIWQGCDSLLLCGTKPFWSVILHTRLVAQQNQKTSTWRPWGRFCSLNRLETQHFGWVFEASSEKQRHRRISPLTSPCFTEDRCIQLLTTCRTHVLPGSCSELWKHKLWH